MSTPTTGRGPDIFQHLRTTKKLLQCATLDAMYVWGLGSRRVGALKSELQDRSNLPRRSRARRF